MSRYAIIAGRGRIKVGATITHGHRVCKWPTCCPPPREYTSEEGYHYRAKDPDMLFDVTWNKDFWMCKADGYGYSWDDGGLGGYGNGPILVSGFDNVELV